MDVPGVKLREETNLNKILIRKNFVFLFVFFSIHFTNNPTNNPQFTECNQIYSVILLSEYIMVNMNKRVSDNFSNVHESSMQLKITNCI